MTNTVSNQSTNNCAGICGCAGVKGFLSIFGVKNIKLASPDDHFPKLDFVFTLKHGMMGAVSMRQLMRQKTRHTLY